MQNFLRQNVGKRIALCVSRKIAYKNGVSQPRRIGLLLALVTLALYLPVAKFPFCLYDDGDYISQNAVVQNGVTWAGVKWAFTTVHASNWHPLTWLSLMVDCGIFGLNPAGPHLINALLHAANVALLFTLLLKLTRKLWPSAFIAALFAWHPMHVESVAWIAERKDVLSTFFALLALLAYTNFAIARSEQNPRVRTYFIWSLLAFALGLMAKPMVVTLPCVLLLLDFWPLRRIEELKIKKCLPLLLEKIPFLLLSIGASVVTFLAQSQKTADAVVALNMVPLHYRLKSIPIAYVEYLWKTFWPSKLAIFYPLPETIPLVHTVVALSLLVLISLIVWRVRHTHRYLLTGWLWFVGMLVPVIGLVQVGGAQIADRYSYLPAVGIYIMVTFAGLELAARWRIQNFLIPTTAIAVLLACIVTMENQLHHWRTNIVLFQHALDVTADNDIARNNLGVAFEQAGRHAEAIEQYRAAIRVVPDRFIAYHNLAALLDRLNRPTEAIVEHREAVRLAPNESSLHLSLARALAASSQTDEALKEFAEAARLNDRDPWPHAEIARIYLQQGRDSDAVEEIRTALRIDPDNIAILTFATQVMASSDNDSIRNGPVAFIFAAKANLLSGGTSPMMLDAMGMACAEIGKFDEAQQAAQQALNNAQAAGLKGLEPIQQRLELYKKHQPWRQSFRTANAPPKD